MKTRHRDEFLAEQEKLKEIEDSKPRTIAPLKRKSDGVDHSEREAKISKAETNLTKWVEEEYANLPKISTSGYRQRLAKEKAKPTNIAPLKGSSDGAEPSEGEAKISKMETDLTT